MARALSAFQNEFVFQKLVKLAEDGRCLYVVRSDSQGSVGEFLALVRLSGHLT